MSFCRFWQQCKLWQQYKSWNGCNSTMESPTCFESETETYEEAIKEKADLRRCTLIGESIIETGWNNLRESLKEKVSNDLMTSYSIRTEKVYNDENTYTVHIVMEIVLPVNINRK